jgi:nitroimidazol reductase NimA-like FMN-containing flavoprotein (pyridoxamine 5'-phosphate oxidase superfamily)
METGGASAGRLVELTEAECWELLGSEPVGRLAWRGAEGLSVVPVNYIADEGRVSINTAAYSAQARECDDLPVAFQVDAVDATARSGWSVLVRGTAHVEYAQDGTTSNDPDVWPAGVRPLRLVIDPTGVTGRRLLSS